MPTLILKRKDGTFKFEIDEEDLEMLEDYWITIDKEDNYLNVRFRNKKTRKRENPFKKIIKCDTHNEFDCNECFQIDHIDRNTLNNKKCNLRMVNNRQNCCNRKIGNNAFPYVYYSKNHNKFYTRINNKEKYFKQLHLAIIDAYPEFLKFSDYFGDNRPLSQILKETENIILNPDPDAVCEKCGLVYWCINSLKKHLKNKVCNK